jgi:hypothetical protein
MSCKVVFPIPHFARSLATLIRTFKCALSMATEHVIGLMYHPLMTPQVSPEMKASIANFALEATNVFAILVFSCVGQLCGILGRTRRT